MTLIEIGLLRSSEIRTRILRAVEQLDDEELNWLPTDTSNSISTLIRHIDGNIQERVIKGILHQKVVRSREEKFKHAFVPKAVLVDLVETRSDLFVSTVGAMRDGAFMQHQVVRNRERSNVDMLHQCAAHFSEHMGQILYIIAKARLKDAYRTKNSVLSRRALISSRINGQLLERLALHSEGCFR